MITDETGTEARRVGRGTGEETEMTDATETGRTRDADEMTMIGKGFSLLFFLNS